MLANHIPSNPTALHRVGAIGTRCERLVGSQDTAMEPFETDDAPLIDCRA